MDIQTNFKWTILVKLQSLETLVYAGKIVFTVNMVYGRAACHRHWGVCDQERPE